MDGFELYKKLGAPKYVLAPMVDMSELAWRMLGRKYGCQLTYTPMFNSGIFANDRSYRSQCMQFSDLDRPIIVQFCANSPELFLTSAKYVESLCDAIDINLGCPQGIARKGHYGAFLQDEWDLIASIIKHAKSNLTIPITAKTRIFSDVNRTIAYARHLESAGVSMLTVHGRTREQKGQFTGLADWNQIKAIKEAVSIPVIANGNIQYYSDVVRCLAETKADGVMSAEGHLHNPALFANLQPEVYQMCKEYLDLVKQYPCPLSYVRAHIFKLCQHVLPKHPEFREKFGCCHSLEGFVEIVDSLKNLCFTTCQSNSNNRDVNLPFSHWICQPYVRPKLSGTDQQPASLVSVANGMELTNIKSLDVGSEVLTDNYISSNVLTKATDKETATDEGEANAEMDSWRRQLAEERRKRREGKRAMGVQKRAALAAGDPTNHMLCTICLLTNRSPRCSYLMCRNCCIAAKRLPTEEECTAHANLKRRRMDCLTRT